MAEEDSDRALTVTTSRLQTEVKPAHVQLVTYNGELGFPSGFAYDGGFGGISRPIDPHWIFEVDFSILAPGGHDAAAFFAETAAERTNKGMTFARVSASTVQISPTALKSAIPSNAACIGSNDSAKVGLIMQPERFNRLTTGARNFANGQGASADIPGGYNPGGPLAPPKPQPAAGTGGNPSPDGTSTAWSFSVSGAIPYSYAPYFQISGGDVTEALYSVWINVTGRNHMLWLPYEPWQVYDFPPLSSIHVVENETITAGWTRLTNFRNNTGGIVNHCMPVAGLDLTTANGDQGFGSQSYSALVDFAQYEFDHWNGEAIEAIDGIRYGDRLSYLHGNDLGVGGRLRIYFGFYPKFNSADPISSSASATPANITALTLFSWDAGGGNRVRAEILTSTYHLKVTSVEDSTGVTSAIAFSWNADDFVEIFVEAGAGAATKIRYRVNGGSWTVFADLGALATVVPTGTVSFFWDGLTDTKTIPCRLKEIRAYDSVGDPDDVLA